ncbi:PLP-dependent aminotransferase family protein [Aliiglaciecola sp. CAU 1673]|uniref:aminotransferase-like domain-containing protein n=1 Tax=Aliiglaciecola sp. CAU 1673 TaxID=3032595 RepID=UPI0023DBF62A|nr:PLP-dependent aminotransferase family protein [Aliiglaciecola sp. CAU 1673]MDF2179357.1 PLP-dependent aminotransferase family protein [Aliiglaciecola sp. CAU 1673]
MEIALDQQSERFLYHQVVDLICDMQQKGTLRPGDRIPSLRQLAERLDISVPTVKQGYLELERLGLVEARPKSGYFLCASQARMNTPRKPKQTTYAVPVGRQEMIEQVHANVHQRSALPLAICNPVSALPPHKALARNMRRVISLAGEQALGYGPLNGFLPLRRQLAFRYLDMGVMMDPEQLVITNGAQEALTIALMLLAKPGDVIAVESPCYFGILELIEGLGMLVYEIPVCPDDGLTADDVQRALDSQPVDAQPIKACIFSTSITNPLGAKLQEENKKAIVELLESRDIGLIEDDVYGDLYFGESRGLPAQLYSQKGLVITCSSFSKTAAPSHRIGWLLSPRFAPQAARLKRALSCTSSLLNQWTMSEYMASGEYERYVRQLREVLKLNMQRMKAKVEAAFPKETRVSSPHGGAVLWLELSRKVNGAQLFQQALEQGISVMPGTLFSASDKYRHCIRLSYGVSWTLDVEKGIERLSLLARS